METDMSEEIDRIHNYLGNGGNFNPEMMDHDAVRELLIDCAKALAAERAKVDGLLAFCVQVCPPSPGTEATANLYCGDSGKMFRKLMMNDVRETTRHLMECESLRSKLDAAEGAEEKCWFIERGTGEWWAGNASIPWSRDPSKAVRFCRREDADAIIIGRDLDSSVWRDCNPFPTEHIFVAALSRQEGKP
jgi:hypothetical protein